MVTKPTIWPQGRFGVPQITPYTYRDGQSLLELITALRDHIVEQLHPNLQKAIDQLVVEIEKEYGDALDQYVNGVQEFQRIHDAFMSDVNAHLIALNDSAVSDLVDDPSSNVGGKLRDIFVTRDQQPVTEEPELITVGDGGDYATLNEALTFISRYTTRYKPEGVLLEVRLLSGFTLAEQVQVNQFDLGHVTITSEDEVVPIHSASITISDGAGSWNAFTGSHNAVLPVISTMFSFDQSATGPINGIGIRFNSYVVVTPGAGFTDAPKRGMNIQQNSHAALWGADFSRAGEVGIRVATGSSVQCSEVVAKDSGYYGLSATSGTAVAHRCDFSGARIGVSSQAGSTIAANEVDVSNCSSYGAEVRDGARFTAPNINAINAGTTGVRVVNGSTAYIYSGRVNGSGVGVLADRGSTVEAYELEANQCDVGVQAEGSSTVNAENMVATYCGTGVLVDDGSSVNATNSTVNNATTTGYVVRHGSTLVARYGKANDCGSYGLSASNASTVAADNLQVTRAVVSGIRAEGSTISFKNGNAQKGSEPDSSDISISNGGMIYAHGATGGSREPNIFDQYGTVLR